MNTPPSQVLLHSMYEALQVEPNNDEHNGSFRLELSLRLSRPVPCVNTISIKEKRRVAAIGDSLLKRTEGPVCRPDPLFREVCCLPGPWVKDVKRKLPTLGLPSDYYPLLIFFEVGSNEVAIKKDFRALVQLVQGSRAQVVFSSILPVAGNDEGRNRKSQQINTVSEPDVNSRILGFLVRGQFLYTRLPATDGVHLSERRKTIFVQELAGLLHPKRLWVQ